MCHGGAGPTCLHPDAPRRNSTGRFCWSHFPGGETEAKHRGLLPKDTWPGRTRAREGIQTLWPQTTCPGTRVMSDPMVTTCPLLCAWFVTEAMRETVSMQCPPSAPAGGMPDIPTEEGPLAAAMTLVISFGETISPLLAAPGILWSLPAPPPPSSSHRDQLRAVDEVHPTSKTQSWNCVGRSHCCSGHVAGLVEPKPRMLEIIFSMCWRKLALK